MSGAAGGGTAGRPPPAPSRAEAQVLVVNAGSSSLKTKLLPGGESLLVERIGGPSTAKASFALLERPRLQRHDDAFDYALAVYERNVPGFAPAAVGHRVVHGGTRYVGATVVTPEVEAGIAELSALAPLHNPGNLAALRAALEALPGVPHVAVFDTAFHATLPRRAYLYGLPLEYAAERGIRRYGFHGPSHDYASRRAAQLLDKERGELSIVTLHLGNGASAAAIDRGVSVDTSMGFTPMEGLLMGTRSGDIDPGVVLHLLRSGMSVDQVDDLLNRGAGLKGMSGVSNDMRDVSAAAATGADGAAAALEVFAYRVRKVVGAYAAAMGGLDAVVFTGGIGENSPQMRAASLSGLGFLGVTVDDGRNSRGEAVISAGGARVAVLVVATDEELMIADATRGVLRELYGEA